MSGDGVGIGDSPEVPEWLRVMKAEYAAAAAAFQTAKADLLGRLYEEVGGGSRQFRDRRNELVYIEKSTRPCASVEEVFSCRVAFEALASCPLPSHVDDRNKTSLFLCSYLEPLQSAWRLAVREKFGRSVEMNSPDLSMTSGMEVLQLRNDGKGAGGRACYVPSEIRTCRALMETMTKLLPRTCSSPVLYPPSAKEVKELLRLEGRSGLSPPPKLPTAAAVTPETARRGNRKRAGEPSDSGRRQKEIRPVAPELTLQPS